jgi:hypothetical protein
VQAVRCVTRATEAEVVSTLNKALAAVEVAQMERDHWRAAAGKLETELRMVLGVWFKRSKKKRLAITEAEFNSLDRALNLFVGNPEPGVRLYELRKGEKQKLMPESPFILPAGNA